MNIIAELESSPRGVYTGCIGYLAPSRQAQFNVAIRTVVVDCARNSAEFGVGGGIVWDSSTDSEYAESLTKAQILFERRPEFRLLESLLWTPEDGFFLLEQHLARLAESADYFAFSCDIDALREGMNRLAEGLPAEEQKVRLLLSRDGRASLESAAVSKGGPLTVGLASQPVDSKDVFLFHKTTNRGVYEAARNSSPDNDDVLLWNERGEITEATAANVVVKLDGSLWTPPISSGLLAGTFRNFLLSQGTVQEKVIRIHDLDRCQEIYLVNSVRKWREAYLRSKLGVTPRSDDLGHD